MSEVVSTMGNDFTCCVAPFLLNFIRIIISSCPTDKDFSPFVTSSSAPPKPPESSKKSRWDVSDQKEKEKKKQNDLLSELLSAARNQTSETKLDQTSASALPASTSTNNQTPDSRTEVPC